MSRMTMLNRFGIVAFWGMIAFCVLLLVTAHWLPQQIETGCFIGIVGIWRYSWQLTHFLRSGIYLNITWPSLRKKMDAHPNPYPKRLYFLIPSYKEKSITTERMLHSVIVESLSISTYSKITVVINLASEQDRGHIRKIIREYPGSVDHLDFILMHQEDGKRLAMGHALRTIARRFNDPITWHKDANDDLVVFMDGDTVLSQDLLKKCLPVFKVKEELSAITTDNEVVSPNPQSLMHQWYKLKFSQRHFLFSSHSLSERVLTLTGRFSIYRASHILQEKFVSSLESDYVDHWIFGRCHFLMGDDKSTWYQLLKTGRKMLYIPDVAVYCHEERLSHFFKNTNNLLSRWYGNMLYNNGRATAVGPRKLGFFIWWCLIDQKISCWTPLIGPAAVTLLCWIYSPNYLFYYTAWVIVTRLVFLLLLTNYKLDLSIWHLPLLLYNQWYGANIKLITLSRRDFQSWISKDSQTAEMLKWNRKGEDQLAFYSIRRLARYGLLTASFALLFLVAYLLIFEISLPSSISSAQTSLSTFSRGQHLSLLGKRQVVIVQPKGGSR